MVREMSVCITILYIKSSSPLQTSSHRTTAEHHIIFLEEFGKDGAGLALVDLGKGVDSRSWHCYFLACLAKSDMIQGENTNSIEKFVIG
eukprot:9552866-Ditylum_brightwellii.AAC.1